MSSGFERPITIKSAIDLIDAGSYLLPAIQREFVWSSEQVEVLFDSIMRGYPINSFMFWDVKEEKIKNEFKFYRFLDRYREFFKKENPDIGTKGYRNFYAVIDGQQRLTSIYLGLKGSYAYKLPRKWLKNNEESIPTRRLYLNLSGYLMEENERQMKYDFQFLTQHEYEKNVLDENLIWYLVNDILAFKNDEEVDKYIDSKGWFTKNFPKETIRKLYRVVFKEPLINYYLETTQEMDTVLDIFIRTNSGGQSLSFSDLLMSITTAHWQMDARKEIPAVVNMVFQNSCNRESPGFLIDKDFVLKTCLVLFKENIKFQVKNFDQTNVQEFEQNWERIKKCILESFSLLSSLGFNNQNLRAKNAVIPIIFYIFHRGLENEINKPLGHDKDKQLIRKWLCLSLLKGVFGSQSDTVLSGLRKVIKAALADVSQQPFFPLEKIKDEFKSNPAKNLSFDDEFIDGLLTIQKDSPDCFPVLSLIYSHLNFSNLDYQKDHLHPASYFRGLKRADFSSDDAYSFYCDPLNWNSIANLQLLIGLLNKSKNDSPLLSWVESKKVDKANQLIPENVSLDVADFKAFITERKILLKTHIKKMMA